MSGDATITGRITVDPPITWSELHNQSWATNPNRGYPDVVVNLATTKEVTADGEVFRYSGDAIVTTGHETSAYHLVDELDRIVTTFDTTPDGTPRTFTGFFHVIWARGEEAFRVIVRDGHAVQVKPTVVWPDGARDEDSVRPDRRMW